MRLSNNSKSEGEEGIKRLDMSYFENMWRVHSEAFRKDLPLLKILHYRSEDLYLMHKVMDKLFISDENVYAYGYFKGERLSCVAFCMNSKWRPRIRQIFESGIDMLRELGPIKAYRALRFGVLLYIKSWPTIPCMRLVSIGSDDNARGKGLGTKMLCFIGEEFRKQGYRFIQLEVEDVNPSKRLYLREGYEVYKHFKIDGVSWSVMIQSLG